MNSHISPDETRNQSMALGYITENTTAEDFDFICKMFEEAIAYQKRKHFPVWNGYDKEVLKKETREKNQYKIAIGNKIAIVFSVVYSDPLLWGDKEKGDAVYLHRIVVNPEFKGRKLFGKIAEWALQHARKKGFRFLRMDTWGNDPVMIQYYESFGFRFVGNSTTPDTPELPVQHRNLFIAMLEMELG